MVTKIEIAIFYHHTSSLTHAHRIAIIVVLGGRGCIAFARGRQGIGGLGGGNLVG